MCEVSKHACKKAKERMGWKKSTICRMAEKAFQEGVSHKDTKGTVNRYITKIWNNNMNANNIKVYGENLYIFAGETLLTLYKLPKNISKRILSTRS